MQVAINLNEINDSYIVMLESMNRYADSLERDLENIYNTQKLIKDLR